MTPSAINPNIRRPGVAEFLLRLSAPFVWVAAIFWLSLTSTPPQLPGILGWDKLLHAGAYGLLTLLIAQYLYCLSLDRRWIWFCSGLAAVACGALLEVLQLLAQTGRTAEWWDLFADAVGALLSFVIFGKLASLIGPLDKS